MAYLKKIHKTAVVSIAFNEEEIRYLLRLTEGPFMHLMSNGDMDIAEGQEPENEKEIRISLADTFTEVIGQL